MNDLGLRLFLKMRRLRDVLLEESGQDLVEYALIVALLAFAAIASMTNIATKVGTSFQNIASKLGSYTS